jgi:DNA-binding NarL/FixJ family response regulator
MEIIKVLIVDDHQIIVDGINSLLANEDDVQVVGQALNGKEALDIIRLSKANIVLMDIDMPVMNGIETTKKIKSLYGNQVRIIILSMHHEKSLVKSLIELGADGYLLKNSDKQELIEAIHKVWAGQRYFSSDVTLSLVEKKSLPYSELTNENKLHLLTDRETEILKLITEGFSNKEIGEKLHISHRTVDTHRTNLMNKLEINNIAGLIRFAIKFGFV